MAKPATALPPLGIPVWHDDAAGFHPLHGIVTALRRAGGAPVLVVAVDLPFAGPALAAVAAAGGAAVVARAGGRVQPLCARYGHEALAALEAAPPDAPLTRTVLGLEPTLVDVALETLRNINTPDDLRAPRRT